MFDRPWTVAILALLLVLPGMQQAPIATPSQPDLTPQDIVDRMLKAYSDCKTYRDSGTAQVTVEDIKRTVNFTTAFSRPSRFRFEFHDEAIRCVIWTSGDQTWKWSSVGPVLTTQTSLWGALKAATGISIGASTWIPGLLVADMGEGPLTSFGATERQADESLGDHKCFHVARKPKGSAPMTMWIDQQTFLIRKIELELQPGTPFTMTFDPAMDEDIGDKDLTFEPPQSK
jgi:outer membrane lipoprotein-sorting protein